MNATAYDTHGKPFIDHIEELRARLFWSALSLIIGALVGYWLHDTILSFLLKPLNQPLSPTGGFDFLIKTCIFLVYCAPRQSLFIILLNS